MSSPWKCLPGGQYVLKYEQMNELKHVIITVGQMTKELVVWKIWNFSVQNHISHINWPVIPWKHISAFKINSSSNDGQWREKILGRHLKSVFIVSSCGQHDMVYHLYKIIYFCVCIGWYAYKYVWKEVYQIVISGFLSVLGFYFFLHTFLYGLSFKIMTM